MIEMIAMLRICFPGEIREILCPVILERKTVHELEIHGNLPRSCEIYFSGREDRAEVVL